MEQKIPFWLPVIWPYATIMMMCSVGSGVLDLDLLQQTQLSRYDVHMHAALVNVAFV